MIKIVDHVVGRRRIVVRMPNIIHAHVTPAVVWRLDKPTAYLRSDAAVDLALEALFIVRSTDLGPVQAPTRNPILGLHEVVDGFIHDLDTVSVIPREFWIISRLDLDIYNSIDLTKGIHS